MFVSSSFNPLRCKTQNPSPLDSASYKGSGCSSSSKGLRHSMKSLTKVYCIEDLMQIAHP